MGAQSRMITARGTKSERRSPQVQACSEIALMVSAGWPGRLASGGVVLDMMARHGEGTHSTSMGETRVDGVAQMMIKACAEPHEGSLSSAMLPSQLRG